MRSEAKRSEANRNEGRQSEWKQRWAKTNEPKQSHTYRSHAHEFVLAISLAGGLLAILPAVIGEIIDLFQSLPEIWRTAYEFVQSHYPEWVETIQTQRV